MPRSSSSSDLSALSSNACSSDRPQSATKPASTTDAASRRRARSDFMCCAVYGLRPRQIPPVAGAAQRRDRVQLGFGIELGPQPADEHLDDVAVALFVVAVEMLGELGLGDHLAGIGEQ